MEYLAFIFITISLLFLIIKNKHFKLDDISRIYILLSYLLKIGSGIALWYIYTYHYSDTRVNDIHKYFNDGKQLAAIFKNNLSDFLSVIKGSKEGAAKLTHGEFRKSKIVKRNAILGKTKFLWDL